MTCLLVLFFEREMFVDGWWKAFVCWGVGVSGSLVFFGRGLVICVVIACHSFRIPCRPHSLVLFSSFMKLEASKLH